MKKLTLFDSTLIVAGSMIGSGIFIVSADMSRTVGGAGWMLLLWVIAGVMTLLAALSYGELAGMMPKAGGQYTYLKEAYNPFVGFLYGWTLFTVIQCGTIAAVAVGFSKFVGVFFPSLSENNVLHNFGFFKITAAQMLGIAMLAVLTFINVQGIQYGKIILRIFTSAKLIALFGLIFLGLFIFADKETWTNNLHNFWNAASYQVDKSTGLENISPLSNLALFMALGVGMVGSLFSSDAWNNVTFIAGEIENPKKNIPRSLLIGVSMVTIFYILANVAFLKVLPFFGTTDTKSIKEMGIMFAPNDRVGVSAANMMFGSIGTYIMALLIIISTFACNNGLILAGARVYQQMANDNLFFTKMKNNNSKNVPEFALWIQFIWCSILCLSGKYGDLLDYVIFAVLIFYILTIAGVFILRIKQPNADRPYKAFGYPVFPAIYILLALLICIDLLIMKPNYSYPGLAIVALGIPVYYIWKKLK
jgi:basic amino acid/polyamine antiporter, APA family